MAERHHIHVGKAHPLTEVIFKYAMAHNLDHLEMSMALAQAFTMTVVSMELYGPPDQQWTLEERLDSLVNLIRQQYPETSKDMVLTKARQANGGNP